ncbi:MAG: phage portal protein [Lachnospiraceae bacterium]|nr:phage portal protein [Lachnospiraceae bacterium]
MSGYVPVKMNLVAPKWPTFQTLGGTFNSGPTSLVKSMPAQDFKAYQEPPIQLMEALGYKDKPASLTYDMLYAMSTKNSVVGAVINTRINQVSTFTKPCRYATDNLGYQIRLRDPQAKPTDEQNETILSIERFIENCGYKKDNDRDDFDTFIRKVVRDSLVYDQMTFEIIRDRRGLPAEFLATDASTIRAASNNFSYEPYMGGKEPKKNEDVKFVQVIDGQVVAWFTSQELAFGVRNPRTSIYLQPYGFSELEQLITQITSHLYAEEYNSKFFSQGGTTKGIINLKQDPNGVMNTEQLESFKRQWRSQVSGLTGAWKTPVLQVPNGIEYINVSQSNREMEFEKWMNYLINIVCAVYQIDPAEVNFPNNGGAAGNGGSVFESSNESKIKNSKDKGLRPLLRFIESVINKYIVSEFSDEYVFNFVGIDDKSEEEQLDIDTKAVKSYKTINEVRAERGLDSLGEDGDVILDSSWLNYKSQQAMQAQAGGGMGGDMPMEDGEVPMKGTEDEPDDYSGYLEGEEPTEQPEAAGGEYSEYLEDDGVEKSLSKLILTLHD